MRKLPLVVLCVIGALGLVSSVSQAACNAIVYCQVAAIYCNGQSSCNSGPDWVKCDNQPTIYCPVCSAEEYCCGQRVFCTGYESCENTPLGPKCDGVVHPCLDCLGSNSTTQEDFLRSLSEPAMSMAEPSCRV